MRRLTTVVILLLMSTTVMSRYMNIDWNKCNTDYLKNIMKRNCANARLLLDSTTSQQKTNPNGDDVEVPGIFFVTPSPNHRPKRQNSVQMYFKYCCMNSEKCDSLPCVY